VGLLLLLVSSSYLSRNHHNTDISVGMYNVPSFTLARAVGGFVNYYWKVYHKREETPIVILASGLILGEGVVSIVNLILASARVPHL